MALFTKKTATAENWLSVTVCVENSFVDFSVVYI